jgi:membrane protease YdiL (CAAX protease family)
MPEPAPDAEPAPPRARPVRWRWVRTVDDQLFGVVARAQPDTPEELRRRQVRSAVVLGVGAAGLAASLRLDHDSPWFPYAALAVALLWAAGAGWSGRLHLGRIMVDGRLERPIVQPILLGLLLVALFVAGAHLTALVPALAQQVRDVLGFAQAGSVALLTVTTLLSGIAEELFFRGGLYAAIPPPHQVWATTGLYVAATVLTGNVMLAFAAAVLGLVTGLQRRATGGVLAPILTHVTWSLAMLHLLPRLF